MPRWRFWLAMVLVVMMGCAQKADEVIDQGSESVDSWGKTLEMVCGQWAEERVPTLYVKQMMKAGEEALGKQLRELEKVGANQGAQKVIRRIHRVRFWIEQNEGKLGDADAMKRAEILAALKSAREGP